MDILIVYPDSVAHDSIVDFSHNLSQRIMEWTGNQGHIYNATRSSLRESVERADPVVASVRDDAVALSGPAFKQLLQVLDAEKLAHG